MNQTRIESLLEACVNTFIGFWLSFMVWQWIVAPLMGIPVTIASNLIITGIFTAVSVARGYVMRRFFNAGLHKAIHNFVRRRYAAE